MNYCIKLILFTFLTLCLGTQGVIFSSAEDNNSHFENYAEFSETHHDNIAEDEHSHSHKHSEDGEEHEHHHNHSSTAQQSIKLLVCVSFQIFEVAYEQLENNYSNKTMSSTEHPSLIFRPPIV